MLDVADGGATDRGLNVMPGWTWSVHLREVHRLRVSAVVVVIVAAQAEIDPTDEGHVVCGLVRVPDDDELLVVRPGASGARVEQHLPAGVGYRSDQFGVRALALVEPVGLRTPDQAEHLGSLGGESGEDGPDSGAGTGQSLFGVAPEIHEVDVILRAGRG